MLVPVAQFTDVRADGANREIQRLGDLAFRRTFLPQTHEDGIALGFGRRLISGRIFGRWERPDIPVRYSGEQIREPTSSAPESLMAVKIRKFRLPRSKSTRHPARSAPGADRFVGAAISRGPRQVAKDPPEIGGEPPHLPVACASALEKSQLQSLTQPSPTTNRGGR
jgi:hypothetical protein